MEGNVDMNAFDRLKKLCDEQGISVNTLEERLEIGRNSLYSWKKNVPKGTNLIKVADYFDVSTDYLLGRTDIKNIPEDEDIHTIAAHHDGDDWTKEELEEIERFKEFVRLKRKKQE